MGIELALVSGMGVILGIALVRILASLHKILDEDKSLWSALRERKFPENREEYLIVLAFTTISLFLSLIIPLSILFLYLLLILYLLFGCFLTDLKEGVLLDSFTLGLLVLGLLGSLVPITANFPEALGGAFLGYGFFWLFNALYKRFRGVEGMYPGDFKLNAALGACLGWKVLIPTLVISLTSLVLFICFIHFIWTRGSLKDLNEKEIPYGCFASIAAGSILIALQV